MECTSCGSAVEPTVIGTCPSCGGPLAGTTDLISRRPAAAAALVRLTDEQEAVLDECMEEFPQLFPAAMMAMMQADGLALDQMARRTRASLKRIADIPFEASGPAYVLLSFIEFMTLVGRWIKTQSDMDYDGVRDVARSALATIDEKTSTIGRLSVSAIAADLPDGFLNDFTAIMNGYRAIFEGAEFTIASETLLMKEDVNGYIDAASKANDAARQAYERMADCRTEMFVGIRDLMHSISERGKRRLDIIRREFKQRERHITPAGKEVFVVHGHDHANRDAVAALLDAWGLKSAVLTKRAGGAENLINKFENAAAAAGFAVVVYTGDDRVHNPPKADDSYLQARPNVLFELGWFYGRYGPTRICILRQKGAKVPSDMGGILTIDFDQSVTEAACQAALRAELVHIGILTENPAA